MIFKENHPMNTIKNQAGFTLMEMIIVVVIIGLLAGLVAPNLIKRQGQATAKPPERKLSCSARPSILFASMSAAIRPAKKDWQL